MSGNAVFFPVVSQDATDLASHSQPFSNGKQMVEKEEPQFHSCQSCGSDARGGDQTCSKDAATFHLNSREVGTEGRSCDRKEDGTTAQRLGSGGLDSQNESPLIPMMLYLHRVKGLVLALLVEPHFLNDSTSMEEVVSTVYPHLCTTSDRTSGTSLIPPVFFPSAFSITAASHHSTVWKPTSEP